MRTQLKISLFLGILSLSTATYAQTNIHTTEHKSHIQNIAAPSASTLGYEAANKKMHQNMAIHFSGDVDKDFINGMIPHHQGAIDMANVALQYSKNPRILKLAKEIIRTQTQEIQLMQKWLQELD